MKEKELNQRLVVINHSVAGLLKSIKGSTGEEMREIRGKEVRYGSRMQEMKE